VAIRLAVPLAALALHGDRQVFLTDDSPKYLELATGLRAGAYATPVDGPETDRPPAFPALVAVAGAAGDPVVATLVANALLGGVATLLVLVTGRRLAGARAGWWGAWLTACEPGLVLWSAFVLTETMMVAVVTGVAAALVRYLTGESRMSWLFVAVACAALAALTRTVAYFLPPLVALVPLFDGTRPWRTRVVHAGAAVVVGVSLLGAWHVRNGLVTGYWGFSTQVTRAAIYGTASGVDVVATSGEIAEARRKQAARLGANVFDYAGDRERTGAMLDVAWQMVSREPRAFLVLTARGLASNLVNPVAFQWLSLFGHPEARAPHPTTASKEFIRSGPDGLGAAWDRVSTTRKVVAVGLIAVLGVYYAAALNGARRTRPPLARWVLAGLFLYFIVLAAGPYASGRFRAPVMPVVALLAGVGIAARPGAAVS
jgi:hypothetical protein